VDYSHCVELNFKITERIDDMSELRWKTCGDIVLMVIVMSILKNNV